MSLGRREARRSALRRPRGNARFAERIRACDVCAMKTRFASIFAASFAFALALASPSRADVGPGNTCELDGKGCETCAITAGKRDAACQEEKKKKGLVLTCTSGGGSFGDEFYCKPGTEEDSGCNAASRPASALPFAAMLAGVLVFARLRAKKRSA